MKTLKEIPFNHELIGQENIIVKFRSGETCEVFVSKNGINSNSLYPVITFDSSGTMTEHTIKGRFDVDDNRSGNDLIMYEEIEEPRVIWGFLLNTSKRNIFAALRFCLDRSHRGGRII